MFNFDEPVNRKGTYSKWDMGASLLDMGITTRYDEDSIALFTADMDFQCAPLIKEALQKRVEHNVYGYTVMDRYNEGPYKDAVIGWFKRRHNWETKREQIFYVRGTMTGVDNALAISTQPGDQVLVTLPIYTPFMGSASKNGRVMVNSQLINENGYYTFDFDDFEEKCADPKTRAFLFCNPHNPTGRVWTKEELTKVYEICRRNDVVIISDEIHGDLVRKGIKFTPIAQLTGGDGIITCTGLAKTFNIPALSPSNVIITDEALREKYEKTFGAMAVISPFTIAATIGAYTGADEWVDELNVYLDGNIDMACNFFKEKMPKVVVQRPEGTYILWCDFRGYGLDGKEVSRRIDVGANVILEHGDRFDPTGGLGFERICTPTQRAVLHTALERIAAQFE